MEVLQLSHPTGHIKGHIKLDGSKSLTNRALLIRALCSGSFELHNASTSDDSVVLQRALDEDGEHIDVGHAGTSFRFLTAYLAVTNRQVTLTGSERMLQRPIGPLVEALRTLGASITYEGQEGYPPLKFHGFSSECNEISIPANTSSQYISALMMVGPTLSGGLKINLEGEIVSRSYIEMTAAAMAHFGVTINWDEHIIDIPEQSYEPRNMRIEADWSAASYYFAMAALAKTCDLHLEGLQADSTQGDQAIKAIMEKLGVQSTYEDGLWIISKSEPTSNMVDYDFIRCPDIAQTVAVALGGMGVQGLFTGLQTLSIKETDRTAALNVELAKVGVHFSKMPARFSPKTNVEYYMLEGKAETSDIPSFETYHDHRMAMAFAPLALKWPIQILDPKVVSKSYPDFWKDLQKLGFEIAY